MTTTPTYARLAVSLENIKFDVLEDDVPVASGVVACLLPEGSEPAADTSWSTPATLVDNDYLWAALVGPSTSAATFKHAGSGTYGLYAKASAAPEYPVRLICWVRIT